MWQWAALLFSVLVTLPGVGVASSNELTAGSPAKDFTLETLDGAAVRLLEEPGSDATVVVFWAAWSPRSAEVLADLQRLYAEYGPERLRVVAVNVEHEEWDPSEAHRISAFARRAGVTYPIVLDKDLSVFARYGFTAVPSSVLADAQGRVVDVLQGYADMGRAAFQDRVLEVLGVRLERQPEVSAPTYTPKGQAGLNLRMGELLWAKGRRHDAVAKVMEAVAEDPAYCQAYDFLARALRFLGREEEAARVEGELSAMVGAPVSAPRETPTVASRICPN